LRYLLAVLIALGAEAQSPLSLQEAVRLALENNPAMRVAAAGQEQAQAKQSEARAGYLPRVDYLESIERGNNPVYVFGSLLTQHQFTAGNFDLGLLNRPDALTNFRSALLAEQTVYDGGQTRLGVQAAGLGRQLAEQQARRTSAELTLAVTQSYYGAVLAAASLRTTEEALATARADLSSAENRRDTGLTTEADVLAFRVHVAERMEQRIRAANQVALVQATLNDLLGKPLDATWTLPSDFGPPAGSAASLADYEAGATGRPEGRQADLSRDLSSTERRMASASYLPQVGFRAGFEVDRQAFGSRGGSNWMAGVTLRLNLFKGGADRARVAGAEAAQRRTEAERARVHSSLKLEARRAFLDLKAAAERVTVAAAIVEQATEGHRIVQNRYQAGLNNATELLRAETALLAARTQRLAALHDQRVAAARLEFAAGRLTPDSEVLK